jgi:hypothetical protein
MITKQDPPTITPINLSPEETHLRLRLRAVHEHKTRSAHHHTASLTGVGAVAVEIACEYCESKHINKHNRTLARVRQQ